MTAITMGALVGWKRKNTDHGTVVTFQLAASAEAYARRDLYEMHIALNDRQLRSLTRDLARAAAERGLSLFARKPWWRRVLDSYREAGAVELPVSRRETERFTPNGPRTERQFPRLDDVPSTPSPN